MKLKIFIAVITAFTFAAFAVFTVKRSKKS